MRHLWFVTVLIATTTFAQTTQKADQAIGNPSLTGVHAQPVSQVTLASTEEGTDIKAEVGITRRHLRSRWITSLRIQAPVQKGAEETKLASLTGFASGGSGGLHLTRVSYGPRFNPTAPAVVCKEYDRSLVKPAPIDMSKVPSECTRVGVEQALATWQASDKQKRAATDAYKAALVFAARETCLAFLKTGAPPDIRGEACDTPEEARRLLRRADQAADAARLTSRPPQPAKCNTNPLDATCWEAQLDAAVATKLKPVCERLNSDAALWGSLLATGGSCNSVEIAELGEYWEDRLDQVQRLRPSYLSLSATVKSQTFKYAPTTIFEEVEESKQGVALGAAYGRLLRSGWYLGAGANIERGYEGGKAAQFCEPVADTNQVQCKTISRTAPTHSDSEVLFAEARKYVSNQVAINPRVSHNLADDVWGYEFLAYLFSQEKKGINGGVNIGYRDDKDKVTVTVFIGAPFALFGD